MISCPLVEVFMNGELERLNIRLKYKLEYKTETHLMDYTDIVS